MTETLPATFAPQLLLLGAVTGVGILHTIVPDHWVPITLIARQQGWSRRQTLAAALKAGTGHVLSTLLIGLVVWVAGVAFATRFGSLVSTVSSLALIAFGLWIAVGSMRELRSGREQPHDSRDAHEDEVDDEHGAHHHHGAHVHGDTLYDPLRGSAVALTHAHAHRHGEATVHTHRHDHAAETSHHVEPDATPNHEHGHKTSSRTALLLILGSSPMIEGIPAFFAAGKYGAGLIVLMSIAFGIATIATYAVLCVYSTAGLQRVKLGAFEKYGEVVSGAFIAAVGLIFLFFPVL